MVLAAAAVLVLLVAAARLVVSLAVVRPVLVRLVAVVWRRWVLAPLVLLVVVVPLVVSLAVVVSLVVVALPVLLRLVVVPLVVSLVVVVWRRWVLAVLGIVVRRRGRCGVVRMMWCVWMPWRSVVLR